MNWAERSKQLRALCKAATPGDWKALGQYTVETMHGADVIPNRVRAIFIGDEQGRRHTRYVAVCESQNADNDAKFIAEARSAIPELIDEIDQRRKEANARMVARLKQVQDENEQLLKLLRAQKE